MEQQQKNVVQITPNQLDCLVECATLEVRERTENEISNHHRNHSYSSSNNTINNRLPINPKHHGLRRRTNGIRTIRYGSHRRRSTRIHQMEYERDEIMPMPQRGNSGDVWLTPKHIIDSLGKFDLDPCAAPLPRPWETAEHGFIEADDGLSQDWFGRVWMNPPYGRGIGAWMKKMAEHAAAGGGGISLVFARTDTRAWQNYVLPYAKSILFVQGRIRFHTPDGLPGRDVANAPSALIAYTDEDAQALCESGISGWIVEPVKHLK